MPEIIVLSLLTGSLGLLVITATEWISWQKRGLERQQEEEEVLTQYESKESISPEPTTTQTTLQAEPRKEPRQLGWEFKILRANRNLFRNHETLQRVCEEEAKAGWILLEKLDERRLRFKRPMALRDLIRPETLNIDPYRCQYGSAVNPTAWLGGVALLLTILLPAYLGYTLVAVTLAKGQGSPTAPLLPPPGQGTSPMLSPPQ